jgi:hypothetical protein
LELTGLSFKPGGPFFSFGLGLDVADMVGLTFSLGVAGELVAKIGMYRETCAEDLLVATTGGC